METEPDSMNKKKHFRVALGVVFVSLFSALLLVPDQLLADSELTPLLPEIGSVSATAKEFGYKKIKRDINRMAAGEVFFSLYDTQGKPFPTSFTYIKDGELVPVEMEFTVDLERSDGQYLAQYPVGLFAYPFGGGTEAPLTLGVNTTNIRSKLCYEPTFAGSCSPTEEESFYVNPFAPGPVYLRKIDIKLVVSGTGQGEVVAQTTYNTRTKLFTIGQPPRLTSISKTTLEAEKTAALTGANFDIQDATINAGANGLIFDLRPANTRGGYQASRGINWVGNWWEDRVHYCGPDKIKFDMPPDIMIDPSQTQNKTWGRAPMPTGTHTVTLQNQWGYSNPLTFSYTGGQDTPENDPACQNPPGVISSISPTSGPPGTVVTINGTGFGVSRNYYRGLVSNSAVAFGGVPADNSYLVDFKYITYTDEDSGLSVITGTQIRMRVSPGAKTGPVTVKPDGKFTIWGPGFRVTAGTASDTPTPTGTTDDDDEDESGELILASNVFPDRWNIDADNTFLISGQGFISPRLSSNNPAITFSNVEVNEEGTAIRAIAKISRTSPGVIQITVADVGGGGSGGDGNGDGGSGSNGGNGTGGSGSGGYSGGDGSDSSPQEGALCSTTAACSQIFKDTQGRDLICRSVDGQGFYYMTAETFDRLVGDGTTHFYGCGTGLAVSGYCQGTSASSCVEASPADIVNGGIGCNASEQTEYGRAIPPIDDSEDPGSFQCSKVDGSWEWKTQKNIRDACRLDGCHTVENTRQSLPSGSYCARSVCPDDPSGLETVGGCLKTSREKPAECLTSGSRWNKLGAVQLAATNAGESSSLDVYLVNRSADAPRVTSAEIGELDFKLEADLMISGQNLQNPTNVEIVGIQAVIFGFVNDGPDTIRAKLVFSESFSGSIKQRQSFIKEALAVTTLAKGVGQVCTGAGCDSIGVNAPRLAGTISQEDIRSGSEVSSTPFGWGIANPFKADVNNVMDLLAVLANFIFQLGIPVAVIIIIYSGILFLVAGDNVGRVTQAVNGLKYAAIGLAILLIGKGFVSLIQSILSIK